MSDKDTGGAAFPCAGFSGLPNDQFIHPEGGMTLRAYFASHAPESVLLATREEILYQGGSMFTVKAMKACAYADALIRELKK